MNQNEMTVFNVQMMKSSHTIQHINEAMATITFVSYQVMKPLFYYYSKDKISIQQTRISNMSNATKVLDALRRRNDNGEHVSTITKSFPFSSPLLLITPEDKDFTNEVHGTRLFNFLPGLGTEFDVYAMYFDYARSEEVAQRNTGLKALIVQKISGVEEPFSPRTAFGVDLHVTRDIISVRKERSRPKKVITTDLYRGHVSKTQLKYLWHVEKGGELEWCVGLLDIPVKLKYQNKKQEWENLFVRNSGPLPIHIVISVKREAQLLDAASCKHQVKIVENLTFGV